MTRTIKTLLFATMLALSACEGPAGPAGKDGLSGSAAAKGDPGPEGQPGPQGQPGPVGPQGERGPAGMNGSQGQTGTPGTTGPAGPAGQMGQMGFPGDTGATGPAGPAGAAGGQGPQGPAGPSKITETVVCSGTLIGTMIDVTYNLTTFSNGMGFASASVSDRAIQASNSGFLPMVTPGVRPPVSVVFDTVAADNGGKYTVAAGATTYTDPDLGAPASFTLPNGSCVTTTF